MRWIRRLLQHCSSGALCFSCFQIRICWRTNLELLSMSFTKHMYASIEALFCFGYCFSMIVRKELTGFFSAISYSPEVSCRNASMATTWLSCYFLDVTSRTPLHGNNASNTIFTTTWRIGKSGLAYKAMNSFNLCIYETRAYFVTIAKLAH